MPVPTAQPSRALQLSGIQCVAIAALCFSLMALSVKAAGRRFPVMELVLIRGSMVCILAGTDLVRRRVKPSRRAVPWLLLRSLVGFVALSCFYYSVIHLPLAEATVIHFTNPVFAALIAAACLGEALRGRELALAAGGLLGVVVMVRPAALLGGAGALPLLPAAAGLAAALLVATAYVIVRRLRREDFMIVVFCFAAVSVVGSALPALSSFVVPRGADWLLLGAVGLSTFGGQVFLTKGLQRERAGRATSVGYLQIVFATGWGWLFFGQLPTPITIAGAAIVVLCCLLLARRAPSRRAE